FFQAEDGIRDATVTGVQTCALPIWEVGPAEVPRQARRHHAHPAQAVDVLEERRGKDDPAVHELHALGVDLAGPRRNLARRVLPRSEERRVGNECSAGWAWVR